MLNRKKENSIRQTSILQMLLLAMLISSLLLSSCGVRKSIESFFLGSAPVETGEVNGFKKIQATSNNLLELNSQLCSGSDRSLLETIWTENSQTPISLLQQIFLLIHLLGIATQVLRAIYHSHLSTVLSKVIFTFGDAPIYIKNRLLLI